MLEAMLPAAEGMPAIPRRMGVFYFGTGMNGYDLFPKDTGPDFTFTPILKPLEPYRGDFTVLSGTSLQYGGGHSGDYTFLTGQVGRKQDGSIVNGISADQVAAARVGQATRFPFMASDAATIDQLVETTKSGCHSLRTLITAIVRTEAFRTK